MRENSFRSVSTNRPVGTITSALYDRRALDVVSNIPLINSLNHLTYLTSNSAKVRDIIANDGALERLVAILHNCYFSQPEVLKHRSPDLSNDIRSDIIERNNKCALCAWKWTLAFQCLVLTGTRGSELIRNKVVSAGVLPLLATVLDNYLLFTQSYDFMNGTYLSFDFKKLDLDNEKAYEIFKNPDELTFQQYLTNLVGNSSFHLEKDTKHYDEELLEGKTTRAVDFGLIWRMILAEEGNSDLYENSFLDEDEFIPSILTPREFYLGRIIPKQDDVIWSLQLLAFISKYTYMKKLLQDVTPDDRLSFRPIIDRIRKRMMVMKGKSCLKPTRESSLSDFLNNSDTSSDTFQLEVKSPGSGDISSMTDDNSNNDNPLSSNKSEVSNNDVTMDIKADSPFDVKGSSFLQEIKKLTEKCEAKEKGQERTSPEMKNPFRHLIVPMEPENNPQRCDKEKLLKQYFNSDWKYKDLPLEINDAIFDEPKTLQPLNIFPLVEKYTVTTDNPHDVVYWSSVIMRNSCRKNETTGVRQCANFSCGKWEEYPRQFAKCRRCKRTKYCSRKCQLKAWTYHRYWCHEITTPTKPETAAEEAESDANTPNEGRTETNSTDISEVIASDLGNLSTSENIEEPQE